MFSLFLSPTSKRQKQKVHIFFRKPFFWHPDKLPKNYFRTPTHYLCFLRYPKNTIKLGKNKQKKILDQVLTQPWTKFWLKKKTKSWTKFWLYSIYILYIHIPFLFVTERISRIQTFSRASRNGRALLKLPKTSLEAKKWLLRQIFPHTPFAKRPPLLGECQMPLYQIRRNPKGDGRIIIPPRCYRACLLKMVNFAKMAKFRVFAYFGFPQGCCYHKIKWNQSHWCPLPWHCLVLCVLVDRQVEPCRGAFLE